MVHVRTAHRMRRIAQGLFVEREREKEKKAVQCHLAINEKRGLHMKLVRKMKCTWGPE